MSSLRPSHDASYISEGKLNTDYRRVLPDETVVAVKRLAFNALGEEDAEKTLDAELEMLGHYAVAVWAKVLGYCSSPDATALVALEYMPHGSLASRLHPP